MEEISFYSLDGIGLIEENDNLPKRIVESIDKEDLELQDNDIVVITSKVVSMYEGRVVDLDNVEPSSRARSIAKETGMLDEEVELIRQEGEILTSIPIKDIGRDFLLEQAEDEEEAKEALENIPSMLITKRNGRICTSAGVDLSNAPEGKATLLPEDPDESAKRIRQEIEEMTGKKIAVIISDSEVTLRGGSMDIAIGCSGIDPIKNDFGSEDLFGQPKVGGVDMLADEITGASALHFGQTSEKKPVVIARGIDYEKGEGIERNPGLIDKGLKQIILSRLKIKLLKLLHS